jgi:hypothetical protein
MVTERNFRIVTLGREDYSYRDNDHGYRNNDYTYLN